MTSQACVLFCSELLNQFESSSMISVVALEAKPKYRRWKKGDFRAQHQGGPYKSPGPSSLERPPSSHPTSGSALDVLAVYSGQGKGHRRGEHSNIHNIPDCVLSNSCDTWHEEPHFLEQVKQQPVKSFTWRMFENDINTCRTSRVMSLKTRPWYRVIHEGRMLGKLQLLYTHQNNSYIYCTIFFMHSVMFSVCLSKVWELKLNKRVQTRPNNLNKFITVFW